MGDAKSVPQSFLCKSESVVGGLLLGSCSVQRLLGGGRMIAVYAEAAVKTRLGIEVAGCDLCGYVSDFGPCAFQLQPIAPSGNGTVLREVVENQPFRFVPPLFARGHRI